MGYIFVTAQNFYISQALLHHVSENKENVILILGGWYVTSLIAVLIAFDRFFEIMLPKVSKFLYDGKRVYVWMLIPLFYLFVTFCFGSAVFNYKYHAFFFDIGLQKTPQVCIKSFFLSRALKIV